MDKAFDYIVVGAGSSGAVVASRLSENGRHSVLCLEAGTKGSHYIWSIPPAGTAFMFDRSVVNWCYHSEPEPSHGSRPLYVPRGKMLGGSSSINGVIYNRGQALDYDTWAQLGCTGWSFEEVLPYLKKLESTTLGSDDFRGRDGPIKVTEADRMTSFFDLFIASAESQGIPYNPDYSGASQEGVAMAQQTVSRGRRQSTATQYLEPARRRSNLTVLKGAEATSLILEGKRCVGVRFRRNGKDSEVRANREVIISGGTVNSPKLLELSGIGDPQVLGEHGIPVVQSLSGVGKNLREHFAPLMKWTFNQSGISLADQGRGWKLLREILRYAVLRKGFIAQGIGTMRVFARSRDVLEHSDIMMVVAPYITEIRNGTRGIAPIDGFFMYTHVQRPESTGTIHIKSGDPFEPPAIKFNFLATHYDRETAIAAVRWARKIVEAAPLGDRIEEEILPGKVVESDEQILDYITNNAPTTHHMVGTCKMGRDDMAVVDERLRVHGIAGLRVADASIMPTMVSGNTNIPCIMIGEKCAAMILEDSR